jgi:hypothetical protein
MGIELYINLQFMNSDEKWILVVKETSHFFLENPITNELYRMIDCLSLQEFILTLLSLANYFRNILCGLIRLDRWTASCIKLDPPSKGENCASE